ncbi:unnamed protein product [Cunninghamella blakesleeana]
MQYIVNQSVCQHSTKLVVKRGYSSVATAVRQPPTVGLMNNKNKSTIPNTVRLAAVKDLFQNTTIPNKKKVPTPLSSLGGGNIFSPGIKTNTFINNNNNNNNNNKNSISASNNKSNTVIKGSRPKRDEEITSRFITFVDENGTVHQRKKLTMALQEFDRSAYFLIEVDPTSNPPVCRLFEKKQLFEKEKANKKKKKTSSSPEQVTKEINFGWNVSLHDMGHKLCKAIQFLEKGNKVKVEIVHKKGQQRVDKETQQCVILQVQQHLKEFKLFKEPKFSGANCMMQFECKK